MLASPKGKACLHKSFCNSFDTVFKRSRVFPVCKDEWPIGGSDPSRRHDEQEEQHDEDSKDLEPRHPILDMSVNLDVKDVSNYHNNQEDCDIGRKRNNARLWPELKHGDGCSDLGRNYHHPLKPEVDTASKAKGL